MERGSDVLPLDKEQSSALPRLPPEILNSIFDYAAPTKSSIALHASGTRRNTIAFHPRQPALASTCRKFRTVFPLRQYYGSNQFLLTESMFLAGRLEEFFQGRPLAKQYLRNVRVDLLGIPWIDPSSRKLFLSAQSRIRFTAKVADDGSITISRLKTRVCCCWIHEIVWKANQSKQINGRLAEFLLGYASKIHSKYVESRQFCPECGMAKTGSTADDRNARFVVVFIIGLFFVVLGLMLMSKMTG